MNENYDDFEVNDEVFVHAPSEDDKYDTDKFNAGWDDDMDTKDGAEGVVIEIGPEQRNGRPDYHIKFPDGETWWWDPAYMELVTAKESISNDDFNSIF